jgi:hypothetical protein
MFTSVASASAIPRTAPAYSRSRASFADGSSSRYELRTRVRVGSGGSPRSTQLLAFALIIGDNRPFVWRRPNGPRINCGDFLVCAQTYVSLELSARRLHALVRPHPIRDGEGTLDYGRSHVRVVTGLQHCEPKSPLAQKQSPIAIGLSLNWSIRVSMAPGVIVTGIERVV